VPYTTILFDVGDTLIQVPRPAPMYQRLLAAHGCTLPLDEVERIVEEARRLASEQLPPIVGEDLTLNCQVAARRRTVHVESVIRLAGVADPRTAAEAFFALYVGTDFFTLYPDVPETLHRLHAAGYQLGIVSNWEPRLAALCAAHGIDHYFQFSVVSELEGYSKPHPHLYRRALELANVGPEQVLHVGDKMREDVEGAAQVGIRAVLLDRAGATEGYQPRITTLPELVALLEDGAAPVD
jgi:HAD superfamily hydrolase (TIGR01662 family)